MQQLPFTAAARRSAFQSGTEPPNSTSPRQALPVPNSAWQVTLQLEQGSSPDMSNRKVLRSCLPPAREEPAPPGSGKPLTTGLRAPRAEEGSWKSWTHLAGGQRNLDPSLFHNIQGLELPSRQMREVWHKDQIPDLLLKKCPGNLQLLFTFKGVVLEGCSEFQGLNSKRVLSPPLKRGEDLKKQVLVHDLQICRRETAPGQRAGWIRLVVLSPDSNPTPLLM